MKIKCAGLVGAQLDYAVAKCEGRHPDSPLEPYSTNWSWGGPIIERETCIAMLGRLNSGIWQVQALYDIGQDKPGDYYYGPTPLIAAMRCFVSSKLGDEVEIPEELK